MIFEQDFAQPHSTNANEEFMEKNFPHHTPTLWRFQGKHELFFGPKWDDFWYVERDWAIISQVLNAFTGILDQPTLQLWWGVFGMRCVTMILKPSCDFVMNFPRKWMRFIDSRAKRFLQTSILENLHLLAIARSVPPKTCSSSLQTQFQQPSNQQVFVNTTVSVAQR